MPRKDRRFTGADILRLYCRNLTAEQQAVVDAIGLGECRQSGPDGLVRGLLAALTSPPLSIVVGRMPAGQYVLDALSVASFVAENAAAVDVDPRLYYEYYISISRVAPEPSEPD